MEYDVFGIGNPLVDILVDVDESFLEELELNKGQFHLVDSEKMQAIMTKIDPEKITLAPGDSTANTLAGIANLGGTSTFCGKVGDDDHGVYYNTKLNEGNVISKIKQAELPTGKAFCFITSDGERTFVVYLGAALTLSKEDILEEDVKACKIVHLTGYQLEDPNLRETSLHLLGLAKKFGKKVSVDLADPGVVNRCLEDLKKIVRENVDIIFANEEEAKEFTGKEDPLEALNVLSEYADIAIVKIGAEGSFISDNGAIMTIEGVKANTVDTTGAGDMYAAGILYGMTNGIEMETAGKIASYAAAKVVEQKGARLEKKVDVNQFL